MFHELPFWNLIEEQCECLMTCDFIACMSLTAYVAFTGCTCSCCFGPCSQHLRKGCCELYPTYNALFRDGLHLTMHRKPPCY